MSPYVTEIDLSLSCLICSFSNTMCIKIEILGLGCPMRQMPQPKIGRLNPSGHVAAGVFNIYFCCDMNLIMLQHVNGSNLRMDIDVGFFTTIFCDRCDNVAGF